MTKDVVEIIDVQAEFIVVNKPANVNFHDEGDLGSGLFNQVKNTLDIEALYPVHRLDKMTSGLLLFAKTLAAAQNFQKQFQTHAIEKYYLAISDKKPTKKQGLIKGDMAKSRRGSWKLLRTNENPAITQFFSYSISAGKRLFLLKPHSGKTHQIRVALTSIGAPILGDERYYPSAEMTEVDRGYLHAYALKFTFNNSVFNYQLQPKQGDVFNDEKTSAQIVTLGEPWLLNWPKLK